MSRQARTLLILGAVALAGVAGLMFMAQRYTSIATQRAERDRIAESRVAPAPGSPAGSSDNAEFELAVAEALTVADTFIEIRRALHATLVDASPEDPEDAGAKLVAARDEALKRIGMEPLQYVSVRAVYRRWLAGSGEGSAALLAAFERRRQALRAVELGAFEVLDL